MPLLSALEEQLRQASPTGPFGGYSGNRSQGVAHWPDYTQLSEVDWRAVDKVRIGESTEALIVTSAEWFLFQHCDSGVASADYTQGKLWGYTVRRLPQPTNLGLVSVRAEEVAKIPSIARVQGNGGKGMYMTLGAIIATAALLLGGVGGFIGGQKTVSDNGGSDTSAELKIQQQDLTTLKNDMAAVKHQLTSESLRGSLDKALFDSGATDSVADQLSKKVADKVVQQQKPPKKSEQH